LDAMHRCARGDRWRQALCAARAMLLAEQRWITFSLRIVCRQWRFYRHGIMHVHQESQANIATAFHMRRVVRTT